MNDVWSGNPDTDKAWAKYQDELDRRREQAMRQRYYRLATFFHGAHYAQRTRGQQ